MKYRSCKRLFILVVSICLTGIGKSQTPETPPGPYTGISINYVRTWDALAPEINENNLIARPLQDVSQATQYIDGIGRPLQAVIKQASLETNGAATDMVSPIVYDIYGREALKYLPFASTGNDGSFKTNPFQQQVSFYNTQLSGQAGETNVGAGLLNWAYRKTNFEQSPLSRPEKMLPEGVSWAGGPNGGRGVENKYFLNTTVDAVRKWKVTNNGITNFGSYASPGLYNPQELYKTIAIDEHGKQVIEFKDKEGKVVLKKVQLTGPPDDGTGIPPSGSAGVWLCTYYIYDDLNNLRCVIQPKGVETVSPTGILTDPTVLAEQCFRYEYDERNRMIIKKIPGAEAVYMVYDRWDRLILMQDGNQRLTNGWIFTKYDEQNRPVLTGLHGDPTNTTLTAMIAHVKANESWQIRYESVNTSLPYGYTTTQTYPYGSSPTILTATHYDDYNGLPAGFTGSYMNTWNSYFSATGNTWPYPQLPQQSMATRGMATWSQVNVLGTGTMLTTVMIYDDKGRVIQVQNTNITGGLDVITTQYTWSGQPLVIVQKQEKQGANAQITVAVTQLTYDNLGRLVKTEKKVSNTLVPVNGVLGAMPQTFKTIAQNEYDKLGQLKNKKLAPAYNNNAGLEALNYDYNIRGWLLGMNRDYARDVIPPSGGGGAYFGFDLGYDKANNNIIGGQTYTNPQYNGNIEGMVWKSKGAGEKRKYDFAYDAANRLLKADFTQYTGSTFNQNAGVNFNIKMGDGINANTAYDANGNIQQMQQWGLKITGSVQIDNLAYTYQNNSNKLAKVTDSYSDPTTKLGDFKDGTNGASDDYGYDVNGNLNLDNNKAISSITYNHLNLPSVITVAGKGTISYTYDAGGNKIKKQTSDISTAGKTISTTTTYIGGMVYESKTTVPADPDSPDYPDKLQFIGHEEGRIRFKPIAGAIPASLQYDYMLKDHLGNVRMVLTEEQQQDKYPVASLEDAKQSIEQQYYTINTGNIVAANTVTGLPAYTNDNGIGNNPSDPAFEQGNSQKLYKLNSSTNKTGLGVTLKVMAGDKIDVFGKSYYFQNNAGGSGVNAAIPVLELLSGLMGTPGGATAGSHTTATELSGIAGVTNPLSGTYLNDPARDNASYTQRPKAFINYIFFDEQFKMVGGNYGFSAVSNTPGLKDHFSELQNRVAQKNGYVYIYVSNESPVNVFFDNLQVVHTRGPILEETHYYPFGLTMSGISSKALNGSPENKKKFNDGTELNSDFDLNIYETNYRSLDPQIGRFLQVDPMADFAYDFSPYCYGDNNPILLNDPLGLLADSTRPIVLPEAVVKSQKSSNIIDPWLTVLGWLGLGSDHYSEIMFKGQWIYKNSKGEFKSIFETKWGRNKTPESIGNTKNYSQNARKGIRATKAVKILKTGGKVIIVVGLTSDIYNVFTAYKNNDPSADAVLANAGVNTAMTAVGFIPGIGWGLSAIYFTIGATVGWENAIPSYIEMEKAKADMRQQKITNFSDFKNSP